MYTYEYPRPALTVNIVAFSIQHRNLSVLLIRSAKEPDLGMWALPGGYVRINEEIEDAAARTLAAGTSVQEAYLEQLYTFGRLDRDPKDRVVSIAHFALIPSYQLVQNTNNRNDSNTCWYSLNRLPILAYDHAEIIAYAIRRLRYKLEYTAVGFQLLPETFTLSQLQQTYEIILGESLDKRNFRRRILNAGVIEPTPYKRSDGGRPARLYRYRDDAVAEVKTRRLFP